MAQLKLSGTGNRAYCLDPNEEQQMEGLVQSGHLVQSGTKALKKELTPAILLSMTFF